ncbi:MAG: dihydrolipoyl dehydrogenase [Polyangiaceae bacterium UTPRO1]|jgi:dihydrolipoamide dehydrogenase|nr:dihydrolipoyl dehydrogenase [Myxococcales bacterium]OQY65283.1 MAG: dihydrolipoyl dehydrogenase [Polyangiaceae bacterium UTPRO1]
MAGEAYDLIVIGSGPGGYVAAIRASQLGMRVACIEKDATLGGTCLNVGCIPSKALLDSSELYLQARSGLAAHGIGVGGVTLDLPAMMARKDKVVKLGTSGLGSLFKKNGIDRVQGRARFADARRVVVRDGDREQTLSGDRILIASGSEAAALQALPFDGERVVSSTEALTLAAVPQHLLVIGGGAIGLELGSVWLRLGAKVTVVEFLDRIVPMMDRQMGAALQKALQKQGMTFLLETAAVGAERTAAGMKVTLESKGQRSEVEADVVLVAVGRRPHLDGLGAREIGVAVDERNRVVVDERFETSVAGVFAIGDVIAGPMLAHKAEEEGTAAVEMMAGQAARVNYAAIPSVVYTWPELASVGLTEEEAAGRGIPLAIGVCPFQANGRARSLGETVGTAKILADAGTDRIVGVHVLGPRASDLIAEAVVAIEFGAAAEDLARSVHAHPTLSEALKEAALAVAKRAIHL